MCMCFSWGILIHFGGGYVEVCSNYVIWPNDAEIPCVKPSSTDEKPG